MERAYLILQGEGFQHGDYLRCADTKGLDWKGS